MHNVRFRVIPGVTNQEKRDEIMHSSGGESGKAVKESLRSLGKWEQKPEKVRQTCHGSSILLS